ncbi:MAG: radical SAM protein [Alphaproteobacteria bacterium]
MTEILVYRREYGYAGLKGLGITANGDLVMVRTNDAEPELSKITRRIDNGKTDHAFSAPVKIFLDPSTKCPLACPFCLSDSFASSRQMIEQDEIKDIVRQIVDMGTLRVKIGGGEPFVYPYFFDIIEQLRRGGVFVSCSTSGILADKMTVDERKFFADRKVKVSISIDGNEQYHDRLRNCNGLFTKAINAVKNFKDSGIKVEIRATIADNDDSYNQIGFLAKLCKELNTPLRLRTVKPKGRAVKNNSATLYPKENYWRFFDNIRALARSNPLINIEEMLAYDKETQYSGYNCGMDCSAGTRSAYVNASGTFCPCGFIESHFTAEKLTAEKNMAYLWHNGESFLKIRAFFQKLNAESSCAKCAFVNSCQGGCPSVRLSAGTEIDYRCPLTRKAEKVA